MRKPWLDRRTEESGEEPMKTIELSSDTRCEVLQRRNYHFRFKLVSGTNLLYRLKCMSAFHRQQWIKHIMLASSRDKVVELQGSLNDSDTRDGGVHSRTLSTESQMSSDTESWCEPEVEWNGVVSDSVPPLSSNSTPEPPAEVAGKISEKRESKGLLRRLSFKASTRLRKNSKSSPCRDVSEPETPSPLSPSLSTVQSPEESPKNVKTVVLNKVFDNPAFVCSPASSPARARRMNEPDEIDLIDIS